MLVDLESRLLPLKWRFLHHNDINRIETYWNGFLSSQLLPHQISRQNIKKCGSYWEKCQPFFVDTLYVTIFFYWRFSIQWHFCIWCAPKSKRNTTVQSKKWHFSIVVNPMESLFYKQLPIGIWHHMTPKIWKSIMICGIYMSF